LKILFSFCSHCSDTILHPSFDFCYYYSQSNEISTLNRQINCPLIMITHLFTGASRKVCYCTVINIVTYLCLLLLSDLCIFFLVSEIMCFKNELITYNKQNIMLWQDAKWIKAKQLFFGLYLHIVSRWIDLNNMIYQKSIKYRKLKNIYD
jgi:hypothetical protein